VYFYILGALLDDLGAENDTEWAVEKLTRLVDYRHRNRKLLVVATNLSADETGEKLTPRVADRVFDVGSGAANVVRVEGGS
jgi:DNA replication protein DnaC